MARPDVLLLSLGTTLGWRVADEMLLEQLRRAVEASPRVELAKVAGLLWRAYAATGSRICAPKGGIIPMPPPRSGNRVGDGPREPDPS